MNLKCRLLGRGPDAVVIVASVRALKMHGGRPRTICGEEDLPALTRGLTNLEKHIENIRSFGVPVVVALNRFPTDTEAEVELIGSRCRELGARFAVATVWADGGAGGEELAQQVIAACQEPADFQFMI